MTESSVPRPWWDKITPRASVRVQMFSAAVVWAVGLGFLLVRGVEFELRGPGFHFSRWLAPIVLVAIVLGIVKARYVLVKYADKAVARIQHRGHACYFGFFAWSSWGFIAVMMGGGIALRSSPLNSAAIPWGRPLLAVIYIAVGTALLIADRIFWISALRSRPVPKSISDAE